MKRRKGYFSISAVSKMFCVHPQTLRLYEKEGLITPKRSDGNTRMFSEEDVDRLEEIIYLTHQLGINLAGVEMILKLKKKIKKLQTDMNKAFKETEDELEKEQSEAKMLIRENTLKLADIKSKNLKNILPDSNNDTDEDLNNQDWKIEYE